MTGIPLHRYPMPPWPKLVRPLVESCACGGRIVAANRQPGAIARAVRAHNATVLHQAWSNGLDR